MRHISSVTFYDHIHKLVFVKFFFLRFVVQMIAFDWWYSKHLCNKLFSPAHNNFSIFFCIFYYCQLYLYNSGVTFEHTQINICIKYWSMIFGPHQTIGILLIFWHFISFPIHLHTIFRMICDLWAAQPRYLSSCVCFFFLSHHQLLIC